MHIASPYSMKTILVYSNYQIRGKSIFFVAYKYEKRSCPLKDSSCVVIA